MTNRIGGHALKVEHPRLTGEEFFKSVTGG